MKKILLFIITIIALLTGYFFLRKPKKPKWRSGEMTLEDIITYFREVSDHC